MFFPAEKVLEAVRQRIDVTEAGRDLFRELFPPGSCAYAAQRRDDIDHAIKFILSLPSAIEQEKIFAKLREVSTKKNAAISDFRWWNIDHRERRIFATLERDGQTISISFLWNNVQKNRLSAIAPSWAGGRWITDKEAPKGFRFEFQHEEYHHTVAMYEKWLAEPIPLTPTEVAEPKASTG
jgi:hypothetical protein